MPCQSTSKDTYYFILTLKDGKGVPSPLKWHCSTSKQYTTISVVDMVKKLSCSPARRFPKTRDAARRARLSTLRGSLIQGWKKLDFFFPRNRVLDQTATQFIGGKSLEVHSEAIRMGKSFRPWTTTRLLLAVVD